MKAIETKDQSLSPWVLADQKFNCNHPSQRLSVKIARNGARRYHMQCQYCGEPIRQVSVSELSQKEAALAVEFDETKLQTYRDRRRTYAESLRDKQEQQRLERIEAEEREWRRRYNQHVNPNNPKWQSLRERVFKRSNGTCEGCGLRRAAHVHHLTYDHLGDEFLWELAAACISCHERFHGRIIASSKDTYAKFDAD